MTEDTDGSLSQWKRRSLYVMGPLYVLAGVAHFLAPDAFERAVPPVFPRPRELVYASGVAEILLGAGVLHPKTREASAWGLVALLVAVFPANVHMAREDMVAEMAPASMADAARTAGWARLPFQAVLVAWAWWFTRSTDEETG